MSQREKSNKSSQAHLLALMFVLAVSRGLSQQAKPGTISGKVKDLSGAPVSGARIALRMEGDSSPAATSTTLADGGYAFERVKAGKYTMTAELPGFQKLTERNIEITPGSKVVIDLSLAPDRKSRAAGASNSDKPGQALDQVSYYDGHQMKPADFTGTIDAGGYSAAGQAETSGHLLEGALKLKDDPARHSAKGRRDVGPVPNDALPAIELQLKKEVELHPERFEANHNLGEFYIHIGKLATAIPYLENAYRLEPSHYVNAYDLALAYLETQHYDLARKQIRSMIRRQDAAELRDLLAEVEEKSGNFLEAANEYERAAQMEPSEQHIFDWGVELLLHQTLEPAIQVFKSGVERYPRSTKLLIGLGIALYSRGRYDEAVEALSQATDLEPSDPRPYLFLAKMYNISSADAKGVTERLQRFAQLQPQNAQAVYYYALSLWKGERGRNSEADPAPIESLLRKAAGLDPRFPEVHLQLGILYAARKDYAEAIREYQQAISLKPDFADAHYRLGQAYFRAGEKARSQEEFALYERLHKEETAEAEKRRGEIQQFVFSLQESSKP